ncbi:hypothetical protein R1flu_017682 [Riccia fluitans]|uniref:Uncharacterized protein n=1 Tax=Riccia fluitans TaxID=41844 RepID=A0ABD1ZH20_9MARC
MVMEEEFVYGVAAAVVILGAPLSHSIGECRKGHLMRVQLFRWWLCGALLMLFWLLFSLLVGLAGHLLASLPPPKAVLFSTHCKVLSKGVDIRSAKVCEGILPHLSQGVRNLSAVPRYECSLDYYWASILKVEFKPPGSQSAVQVNAESPKTALSLNCRPSFGTAWRTMEAYQVNGTYPCRCNPTDMKMVEIAGHMTTDCKIKEPSYWESLKQFFFSFLHSEIPVFTRSSKTMKLLNKVASAVGLGTFYAVLVVYFTRTTSKLYYHGESADIDAVFFEARMQLVILLIASLFCLVFLSNHYVDDDMDLSHLTEALYRKFGL